MPRPAARLRVESLEDRLTPAAGDLLASFGAGGVATVAFTPAASFPAARANDAVVDSLGRTILVGFAGTQPTAGATPQNSNFSITRLTPAGTIDPTFAPNAALAGRATVGFGLGPATNNPGDSAQAVGLQSDGKIIVAGLVAVATGANTSANVWGVARLTADGVLDRTFGSAATPGRFAFTVGTLGTGASDLVVQPDDKIVVVGSGNPTNGNLFEMVRLTAAGTPDFSFDNGFAAVVLANPNPLTNLAGLSPASVALASNGDIVLAAAFPTRGGDFTVARTNSFGNLVTSFGSGGFAYGLLNPVSGGVPQAFGARVGDLTVLADGSVVVVGGTQTTGNVALTGGPASDFTVVKFTRAGVLDTTFDTDGRAFVPFDAGGGNLDIAEGVAVQPDGKLVLGGAVQTGVAAGTNPVTPFSFASARLTPTGQLDTSYGGGTGKKTYPIATPAPIDVQAGFRAVTFSTNGSILLAGGDTQTFLAALVENDAVFNPLPPSPIPGTPGSVRPNDFLAVGGDNLRVAGFYPAGGNPFEVAEPVDLLSQAGAVYDTGRRVTPDLSQFFGGFGGEIRTASGDINGDGIVDFVISTGPGTVTRFAVVSGDLKRYIINPTTPFAGSEEFTGGAFVSVGDLNADGRDDVVVSADQGGGPRVVVFSLRAGAGVSIAADFFGINDPAFRGGARAAVGDVNADGRPDLAVAAGFGGGPRVALYNGRTVLTNTRTTLVNDFFAFSGTDVTNLRNGVFLAVGDLNGDGFSDVVFGGGPGGGPRVLALDGRRLIAGVTGAQAAPLANYFVAGDTTSRGGVRVAVKNVDGDVRRDIVVGSGEGQPSRVRVYYGATLKGNAEPAAFEFDPFGGVLAGGVYVG